MTIQSVLTGQLGEKLAFNRLRNLGRIRVQPLKHAGDLVLDGVRIEIKTSRICKVNKSRLGWQWCLYRKGKTDFKHSHFIVLIGLSETGEPEKVYILPTHLLREDRHKINIVRGSSSKWFQWENRFDLLEAALAENDLTGFDFETIEPVEF